ncbi:hypothetical protein LEP1GSC065_2361 [Leptospira kirschneri serovar Sokoine str. RM1]|nr:hypothetical protein LEP1GSC065_2361 [Leptospira kirschneri serovar Sokoine str. RM1]
MLGFSFLKPTFNSFLFRDRLSELTIDSILGTTRITQRGKNIKSFRFSGTKSKTHRRRN